MQGVPYTAGMKDLLSVFQAYQVRLCCGEGSGAYLSLELQPLNMCDFCSWLLMTTPL